MNYTYQNLAYYLPALIELGGNSLDWDKYDKLYTSINEDRYNRGMEGNLVQANIYDIILNVKKGGDGGSLLNYFNQILERLNHLLDNESKAKIRNILHRVLSERDHKYLNFVGELSVLHQFLDTSMYTLQDVEVRLPNGKTADFSFLVENGNSVLVEVHNVHLEDDKVIEDNKALFKFFVKRWIDKITEKRKGLPKDFQLGLVQVLWGTARSLYVYNEFFKANKERLALIEPMAFVTISDTHNPRNSNHYFGKVSTLFKGNIDTSFMNI